MCLFLCWRWCTGFVKEASTRWCRLVSEKRDWTLERSTSSFALTPRRTPPALCSEWAVLVVSGRGELLSFCLRGVKKGWVRRWKSKVWCSSKWLSHHVRATSYKLLTFVFVRHTTRARATSATCTSQSPATKAASICTPVVPACCPRAWTQPCIRCTSPVASLTTCRAAGDPCEDEGRGPRDEHLSSTLKTWVSEAAVNSMFYFYQSKWTWTSQTAVSNVLVHQDSTAPDGFLSSAEFSMWASTVRLREDEPHPVLKRSHFMSLPADLQPQVF